MTIKLEEFNDCPGTARIQQHLKDTGLLEILEVADAKQTYWQNNDDTLVLRIKENAKLTFENGVKLGQLARQFNADEFHENIESGSMFFRLWWD